MTTLRGGQVSTEASRNPIIVYERRNNREENLNQNKEKDKEKYKEELPTSYTPKAPFSVALEANAPSPFTKKGVHMDEMMELFKQVQINLLLLDVIK